MLIFFFFLSLIWFVVLRHFKQVFNSNGIQNEYLLDKNSIHVRLDNEFVVMFDIIMLKTPEFMYA